MTPRVVIAGTKSGVGKTTITTGIMAALHMQGLAVQGFKVGPDYIDPSYHAVATGRTSSNLDVWLMGEEGIKKIFAKRSEGMEIAIIEGVMGLYDGNFADGSASTAQVAKILQAPVILVLDCRSMGQSAAAHVLGFKMFDQEVNLAGVILNQIGSERHGRVIAQVIEETTGVPVVGTILRDDSLALPSRHLGLIPMVERSDDMSILADTISKGIDLEKILEIAKTAPKFKYTLKKTKTATQIRSWAVASDEAFSFTYKDSLDELEQQGIKLLPFSPLRDKDLPKGTQGVLIGGGFPEVYAEFLAKNKDMLHAIKKAAASGLPVYAECGGLMYLTRSITTSDGQKYEMAGVVPAETIMTNRLVAMGYVEGTALSKNLLCKVGEKIHGHVFHYSEIKPLIEDFPWAWHITFMRGNKTVPDGYAFGNVLASYVHLHFSSLNNTLAKI